MVEGAYALESTMATAFERRGLYGNIPFKNWVQQLPWIK